LQSEIGAEEAEEVGVEHLLRDIKDTTVGTLSQKVTNQVMGLRGLHNKLDDMNAYVQQVSLAFSWIMTPCQLLHCSFPDNDTPSFFLFIKF
jgi:hypothetical protein